MDSEGTSTDSEGLSEELESDASKMKQRSEALGDEISDVREDWHQKQADGGVPGAEPAGKPFADDQDAASPTGGDEGGQGEDLRDN
jgi:hypothetical protein